MSGRGSGAFRLLVCDGRLVGTLLSMTSSLSDVIVDWCCNAKTDLVFLLVEAHSTPPDGLPEKLLVNTEPTFFTRILPFIFQRKQETQRGRGRFSVALI